jgi:integrase
MSYYSNKPPEKMWRLILERVGRIPNLEDQEAAKAYVTERRTSGNLSLATLAMDVDEILRLARRFSPRTFKQLAKTDLIDHLGTLGVGIRTRHRIYLTLRAFFRWLYQLDAGQEAPPFQGFRMKQPPRKKLKPEDLITPEELQEMMRYCLTSQERCLIAVLYEAGPRAGEILCFNVGSVELDDYGYLLHMPDVEGLKIGPRPLRIVQAKAYLQAWMNDHVMRDKTHRIARYGVRRVLKKLHDRILWQ